MRVLFVNRFYWPDENATAQLLADLCENLAKKGFDVSVITSGSKSLAKTSSRSQVCINRVCNRSVHSSIKILRIFDYVRFIIGINIFLLRNLTRGDIVIALTDPPMLGAFIMPSVQLKGAHLVQWLQDIYPEVAEIVIKGRIARFALGCLRPFRNLSLRVSRGCVIIGRDQEAIVLAAGVPINRVKLINNWAPKGLSTPSLSQVLALKRTWRIADKFVVAYSGNFGRVHDFSSLLNIARILSSTSTIAILLIGDGAQKSILKKEVEALSLTNITFLPLSPREILSESLSVADIHLVTLKPGCESCVFPSKVYGITALGKPLLFLGSTDSEIAASVRNFQMGECFHPKDFKDAASFILSVSKDNARLHKMSDGAYKFAAENASEELASIAWSDFLRDLDREYKS